MESRNSRKAGFGGVNRYKALDGYEKFRVDKDVDQEIDVLRKFVCTASKSLDEIVDLAKNKKEMLASIPAIQPVRNKNLKEWVFPVLGIEFIPYTKQESFTGGWTFLEANTPIYATGNGTVSFKVFKKRLW